MKELLLSIFASAKDRVNNVFAGTFAIAWIISNWEPISIFLFWDKGIIEKWSYILKYYDNSNGLIWKPFLLVLLYILIFPVLNWGIAIVQAFFTDKMKVINYSKIVKDLILQKDVISARIEAEQHEEKERNIKSYKQEFESLKSMITSREETIQKLKIEKEELLRNYNLDIETLSKHHEQRLKLVESEKESVEKNLKDKIKKLEYDIKKTVESYENLDLTKINEMAKRLKAFEELGSAFVKNKKFGESLIDGFPNLDTEAAKTNLPIPNSDNKNSEL